MKKLLFQVCVAGSIALGMSSCHPDNDYTLSAPADRIAQLNGTWKLQNVIQTDLIAKGNNFADPSRPEVSLISRDITEAAPFTDLAVTFQLNNGLPGTFTINYGNAPKIFKVSTGTWLVDNVSAPGTIRFVNGTDTAKTTIGAVNTLTSGILTLTTIKYQGVKPVIQYNYNFTKN